MPQPGARDLLYEPLLSNVSIAFMQDQTKFIADKVMLPLDVPTPAGKIPRIKKGTFLTSGMKPRADGAESALVGWEVEQVGYATKNMAVKTPVTDRQLAEAFDVWQPRRTATMKVTTDYLITREREFLSFLFNTANWTQVALTGAYGGKWDVAAGRPLQAALAIKRLIRGNTGMGMNTVVVAEHVHDTLSISNEVQKFIMRADAGGAQRVATKEDMARYFQVENYHVACAVQDVAPEGTDSSVSYMVTDGAWFGYVAPMVDREIATAGFRIRWNDYVGNTGDDHGIRQWYEDNKRSEFVELETEWSFHAMSDELGVFIPDCIGS